MKISMMSRQDQMTVNCAIWKKGCSTENKICYDMRVIDKMRRPQTGKQNSTISNNLSAQKSRRNQNNCQWIYETEYKNIKTK